MTDIWAEMEEDAAQTSGFYKPVEGKINQVRVLTDPIKGMTAYKQGEQKVNYSFVVNTMDNPKTPLVWGVSAKGAMSQLVGIMKANQLKSIVGTILQIAVAGEGMKRTYTILPIALPTPASVSQVQADFPLATLQKTFPNLYNKIPTA